MQESLGRRLYNRLVFTGGNHMLNQKDLRTAIGELRHVELLDALSDEELGLLASAINSRQFGKGEVLMQEGYESDCFFILRQGTVEAYVQGQHGAPVHILDIANSSRENFFGEIAILTGGKCQASIRATTDVEVWEVGRDALAKLFRARPAAGTSVAEVAERRLKERNQATSSGNMLLAMREVFDF
jgi:CRP/FNR family transcriptional regulator, anaerobic regulatory protein